MTTGATGLYTVSNGYIQLPVTTTAGNLYADALATIAQTLPGWVPRESHIEVLLLEQFAQMASESAIVAAQVPLSIFSYFGSLIGINPNVGAAASTLTQWTFVDTAGYTVPAGTVVAFAVSGNQAFLFQTTADITVLPGSQTTAIGDPSTNIVCQTVGAFANGLANQALQLVTSFSFVSGIVSTATTSGGADAETQSAFLNRLSAELRLLSPRPILPQDFAALAVTQPAVGRAVAIDELSPGRVVSDMTLTIGSPVISAADAFFDSDDVGRSVTDADGFIPPNTTIVAPITSATVASMSQNALGSATEVVSLADLAGVPRNVTVAVADIAGMALDATTMLDVEFYLNSLREINFDATVIAPTYTLISVTWQAVAQEGADPDAVNNGIITTLNDLAAGYFSPAIWGGGDENPPEWDSGETTVRYLSVASIIANVPGVDYVISVGLSANGGPYVAADIVMPGNAPLPIPGNFPGTTIAGETDG